MGVWGVCEDGSEHVCSDVVMDVLVLPPQEPTGRGEWGWVGLI